MLNGLVPGDVVTVTRIDRLARSTFGLFAIVKRIVDAGGQVPVSVNEGVPQIEARADAGFPQGGV